MIIKHLFCIYLLVLGCVHAFAITDLISIPFVLSLLLLVFILAFDSVNVKTYKYLVIFFVAFSVPALISVLAGYQYWSAKTFSHLLSYVVPIFIYFFVPLHIFAKYGLHEFKGCILIGWVFIAAFTIIEFLVVNFVDAGFFELIPRPSVPMYDPTAYGLFIRSRGLAEESALDSLYLGVFYYILLHCGYRKFYIHVLFICSLFVTFGTMSWIALLSVLTLGLFLGRDFTSSTRNISIFSLLLVLFLVIFSFQIIGFDTVEVLLTKFTSGSMDDRANRFSDSLNFYMNSSALNILFGLGPGYYTGINIESTVGLYPLILFQTGLFGVILFAFLILFNFCRAYPSSIFLFQGLVYSIVCYVSISNYWLPWFWMLLAIVCTEYYINKQLK